MTGWLQDENYKTNNLISDYSNPLNNRYLYYLEEASRPKASSSNNQFTINNTNWGYYNINWYSTVDNNQLIHTEKAFSNGSLIINMPTSLRNSSVYGDAAFIAEFDCNTNYWNWSGLNGAAGHNVSGYLAVSSEGKVFYRTTDNKINCIYYSNNNWTWSNLNGASGYNVLGDLAINSSNQVFYRTTDNSINCIYYSNGSWQWSSLNGAAGHNVAGDIVINSSNQIFYKTTDNSINCIYYSNGSWRWSGLNGAAGNNVVGELAINSANQIFYKTANNSINCIYYSSGIWKWSGLNGAAGQNVSGYLTTIDGKVFYKTNSNSINCIYYSNGVWNWSGLNNVANGITSGYLVGGKDKVFFKSTDNSIKAIYWSGIWKLDDLHKAAGHNVGGDIALNSSNSNVFYKTYGSDRSLNAIYWTNSCSSSGLKSATTSKSTFEEFSDLNEPVENSVSESLNIVKMYPNPSSDVVEILKVHGKIKVFNSYGVLVFEGETSSEQFTFSVDGWSKGLYIVEVSKLNGEKQNIQLIVN